MDPQEQQRIINEIHLGDGDSSNLGYEVEYMAGHFGRDRTRDVITQRWHFDGVAQKVAYIVKRCQRCQMYNSGSRMDKAGSKMTIVPVPTRAMKKIGIDLIGPLHEVQGMKYIVTAVDFFTKWVKAEPLPDKCTESVADFILGLVSRYGAMSFLLYDQGKEFNSKLSKEVFQN